MADALIITDGRAGNLRQARALAAATGLRAGEVQVQLRPPWAQLAPRMPRFGMLAQRNGNPLPVQPPWPQLVIGCGRQAAWATRWLRRHAGAASYCVQILDPRINSRHWDLLIAPRHDHVDGDNVLHTTGSLNPVDSAWLARARADFQPLSALAHPRIALLLGGPRRGVVFDSHLRDALVSAARTQAGREGCVLLCASPRTPDGFARQIRDALVDQIGACWLSNANGPNPYPGYLAWADHIVVTPDSVNMLSEAAACGVPVHSLTESGLPPRLAAFHQALRQGGWLHDLDETRATAPLQPLRETGEIASTVLQRLRQHRRLAAQARPPVRTGH